MQELRTTFKPAANRARCPLHPKQYCLACQYGVTGPDDCPIAYLAHADYDTRVKWAIDRLAQKPKVRL